MGSSQVQRHTEQFRSRLAILAMPAHQISAEITPSLCAAAMSQNRPQRPPSMEPAAARRTKRGGHVGLQHIRAASAWPDVCVAACWPRAEWAFLLQLVIGLRRGRQSDRHNTDCRRQQIPSVQNPGSEPASHAMPSAPAGHCLQRFLYVRIDSETIRIFVPRTISSGFPCLSPASTPPDANLSSVEGAGEISNRQVGW